MAALQSLGGSEAGYPIKSPFPKEQIIEGQPPNRITYAGSTKPAELTNLIRSCIQIEIRVVTRVTEVKVMDTQQHSHSRDRVSTSTIAGVWLCCPFSHSFAGGLQSFS